MQKNGGGTGPGGRGNRGGENGEERGDRGAQWASPKPLPKTVRHAECSFVCRVLSTIDVGPVTQSQRVPAGLN